MYGFGDHGNCFRQATFKTYTTDTEEGTSEFSVESATFFKKLLQLSKCMLYWTLMLLDVDLDSVVHCRLNFLTEHQLCYGHVF